MTKVMIEDFGWVNVVMVLGWHAKMGVGHYAGLQARAWQCLAGLNRAVNCQFSRSARGAALKLMSNYGCQPTLVSFFKACWHLGVNRAFASHVSRKGTADTGDLLGTFRTS
ncbi:hypothetical protein [Fundidesulfovibrio agrisoli]|uniref:hypothetical protein n=1 Tax=Fundidesulfovibrio agrisoli TaxID=2922717 RepID=UPI001FADEA0E|nr:hypothetical protein [Fundidesulfovibrio agrisoli]